MNDPIESELNELEAELRSLRPAPLSAEFLARLAAATRPPARPPAPIRRLVWTCGAMGGLAAAAAIAITAVRDRANARSGDLAANAEFKPISAEALVTSAQDDGDVVLGDGTRARRINKSVVDTMTWKNPATNAILAWSVPHEEVQIVPITYH